MSIEPSTDVIRLMSGKIAPQGGSFFLLDPSFKGAEGGSMTFGGGVAAAAVEQNIPMKMAVNREIAADQQADYNALPIFTVSGELGKIRYQPVGVDTSAFFGAYARDLDLLSESVTSQDVLWDYYLLGPMQVVAYANWLLQLPSDHRPKLLVGIDVYSDHWFNWLSPVKDVLKELVPWLRITTTSFTHKPVIEKQLGVPVQLMPRPLKSRVAQGMPLDEEMVALLGEGAGAPLVGFFTDANTVKSFHLLHGALSVALEQTNLRFAVQVRGGPVGEACEASYMGLLALSKKYPDRIRLFNGPLPYRAYKTVVELCDGIMIAYDPASHFSDTPSGTMCEAFAAGTVPLVVKGTSMAKELDLFGIQIPVADRQDVDSFIELLKAFSDNHAAWWQQNEQAIDRWNEFQSYGNLFKHVFELEWA